ncbi:MAG: dCTP deaminase [Candidatus Woesearchaeota archaeon]
MILSDKDIKVAVHQGRIKITPFDEQLVDSSGLGIRINSQFRIFKKIAHDWLDPFEDQDIHTELIEKKEEGFLLQPGEFVLASSKEYLAMPNDLAARLIPRNSLSRLGIILVGSAGIVEPGFEGNLTFTIGNISKIPVLLRENMHFCKLVFEPLSSSAEIPYHLQRGSKYNLQKGPVASRLHLEKELKMS